MTAASLKLTPAAPAEPREPIEAPAVSPEREEIPA